VFLTFRIKPNIKIMATTKIDSRPTGGLLILVMGAILITLSARADVSEQQAKREANFKAADLHGDGALTQAEFRAFIDANAEDNLGHATTLRRFGAYDRAFKKLDKDESSTVSWLEVMDALAEAN
jgi:Ca2+-binding EF-hand superfamily protein